MLIHAVRSLWAEPRVPAPPPWTWRDRVLVLALAAGALLEVLLRDDLVWRTSASVIGVGLLVLAPWRRTRPLLVVAVVFGVIATYDTVAVLAGVDPEFTVLWITIWILSLPYALLRWGSGREIVIGAVILLTFLAIAHGPGRTGWGDLLLGLAFFALSATLGTAARYRATSRVRERDQVRLREREQLARELHDTVAHHVSAIAIQAQAGRAVAATSPERAVDALAAIEAAASRTLREMRAMRGDRGGSVTDAARDAGDVRADAELAPQPGVADITRLARDTGEWPRVDVQLIGDLDEVSPTVAAATFRLAQESVTNAMRHARDATRIEVRLRGDGEVLRLTVVDDGDAVAPDRSSWGYGIVGMTERATLLGGRLSAGPGPERGWSVEAVLPRAGAGS
jgi:signal transduction histidine kinase